MSAAAACAPSRTSTPCSAPGVSTTHSAAYLERAPEQRERLRPWYLRHVIGSIDRGGTTLVLGSIRATVRHIHHQACRTELPPPWHLHMTPSCVTCREAVRGSAPPSKVAECGDGDAMTTSGQPNKLAFLSMQAPEGYVAGLGRGASGFTTRSDIGPAREGPSAETIAAARRARGEDPDAAEDEDEDRFQDPEDETGLFASSVYEQDDEEADRIWENVDRQMDERRRKQREAREKAEMEEMRQKMPKIQAQFADLKRNLTSVSEEEWASLPEPGNLTGKRRKAAAARESRDNRTYAVPDSVLVQARDRNEVQNEAAEASADGTQSSTNGIGSLTEIGEARNRMFSRQLDQASSTASGTSTSIDPKGYLTELSSVAPTSGAEIGDVKRARSLLDSVIKTNPKHAPGWIAAARLEELAGKMAVARKIIAQGCEQCPRSEDVWLENARLNTNENAKVILARAAQHLTQSVSIWLKAEELENVPENKKRVLRKALEHVPNSVKLWKELVGLEESQEDARVLLSGAVEAIPMSVELWLALARLSPPNEAKSVLNKARRTIPTSHEIWIAAARLIEQLGEPEERIDKTIATAVASLTKAGAVLSRDQWLLQAEQVEREGSALTSAAIVKATIHIDIDDEDRNRVWVEDAQSSLEKGHVETARAIFACALHEFPDQVAIWEKAVRLEKQFGTPESLQALLERAVSTVPGSEPLWLLYANEKRLANDISGARDVLIRAFDRNLGSELISLAAADLEAEMGEKHAAKMLLERARAEVGSERVWLKSVVFERNEGRIENALKLVTEALERHSKAPKLHMLRGQLNVQLANAAMDRAPYIRAARDAYAQGRKQCPASIPIWLLSSRLEEHEKLAIRARAIMEKARLAHERSDEIWAESAAVEMRAGSAAQAKTMLSRGLQACPASGLLWSESIWLEPRAARKTRGADALRRTGDSPMLITAVARMFWSEGRYDDAEKWFGKAIERDGDWGDGWAWYYAFLCEQQAKGASPAKGDALLASATRQDPKHGALWQEARKDVANLHKSIADVLKLVAAQILRTHDAGEPVNREQA